MVGQILRGFVGQEMSGSRKALTPATKSYAPGSHTFRPTKHGWYKFVLYGGGGGANIGVGSGGSGALVVAVRHVSVGQVVSLSVGAGGSVNGGPGGSTTVTLPTGEVLTAQGGQGVTGGIATANGNLGDTAINGANGTLGSGAGIPGASAPSTEEYQGGSSGNFFAGWPGGGGPTDSSVGFVGGGGSVLVVQVRMQL
jgi:hypothetical protein